MSGRAAAVALLAAACLAAGGCARLAEALLAPQQVAADTAANVADRSGAMSAADSFGTSVDRLLAGQPQNAGELERIRGELQRRALAGNGGSAQADPARLSPWHPRTPEIWPRGDRLVLERLASAGRGTYVRFAPLPDGIPAGDPPIGMDISPVRLGPADRQPHLPERLSR